MTALNTVILVGRAGNYPEIKHFESGRTQAVFSLAVSRPRSSLEEDTETDWFKIELWDRQAEIAHNYVKKGSLVGIRGKLVFHAHGDDYFESRIVSHGLRLIGSRHDIVPPGSQDTPF